MMLEAQNITSRYGPVTALHHADFSLMGGEVLALVGTNGAGKSTLVMSIAGHVIPEQGNILLEGEDITRIAIHDRASRGIGLVPEGRRVFPDLTVRENLITGGYVLPRTSEKERLEEVYDIFPRLFERAHQLAGSLSGGEQQMLAFGRAIMLNPKIMLIDEISLGLMPSVINECYAALEQLRARKIAIILVDQNSDASLDFADKAIWLESGHVKWQGKANDCPLINGSVAY
jgi:branched-chain amino acid transport system ATP-binding protein